MMANLRQLLRNVFVEMRDNEDNANDDYLSREMGNAIETFFESAQGTTVDSGTTSKGQFNLEHAVTGNVSSLVGDKSTFSSTVLSICNSMKNIESGGNMIFATGIANGLLQFSLNSTITCNVSGWADDGEDRTFLTDISIGNLMLNDVPSLISDLNDLFMDMNVQDDEYIEDWEQRLDIGGEYQDSEDVLADGIAKRIKQSFESATLNTIGQNTLFGTTGVGNITFN